MVVVPAPASLSLCFGDEVDGSAISVGLYSTAPSFVFAFRDRRTVGNDCQQRADYAIFQSTSGLGDEATVTPCLKQLIRLI
jgi:hypothetical protein